MYQRASALVRALLVSMQYLHNNISILCRYGDATERTFKQSELPFLSQSVSQTTYVPLKGQPADICRPLDVRFGKGEDQKEIPFANETSYKDMFQPQEIQQPQQCLAHALLNAKLTN